jgi:Excalibur calcium-binding domain
MNRGDDEERKRQVTTPLNPQGTPGRPPTQPPSEAGTPRWKWSWITIGGIVLLLFIVGVSCGNEKSSTPTITTTTPETQASATPAQPQVTVPGDLVGKNAQLANDELRRLGIINIGYVSQDGSKVAPLENWTVTKVAPSPGTVVVTTDTVLITATEENGPGAPVAPPAVSAPVPAPPAAPALPPADSSPGGSTGGSAYYSNCAAARAAGVAPLHRGDPGYRSGLDRDGDGVACE